VVVVVGEMLRRNANQFPDRTAIIFEGRSITYRTLNERVNALSSQLVGRGLQKGDRLGVLVHNGHRFVEAYFAAAKTGAIFCPYNTHFKEGELRDTIRYSTPRALVFDADFEGMIEGFKTQIPSVEQYIEVKTPSISFADDYEELLARGETREPMVSVNEDAVMSIFFTSGTTGEPKGAMRTHRHVVANIITGLIEFKIGYNERILVIFPMYHVSYEDNVGRSFFLPNTMIIRREGGFDPDEVLDMLSRERITFCHLVPTMINAFLRSPKVADYDLTHLRTIFYAGAPMPVELLKRALKVFRSSFFQGYGLTESGPQTTLLRAEDHVVEGDQEKLRRLGSVGTPVVGIEVKLVDEQDNEVAVGEVGEIVVRGEATMKGYLEMPEQTAEKLKDGWLHTGDIGKKNEDGYFYLVDRKHDLIISGGINIYPREVEEVLYRHPKVFEAAVLGVPDDYWGEAVKAVVVLKDGVSATEEEIIRFCGEHLAGYKKPKSVEFWKELPKNPTGKILKRALREKYWKDSHRTI
jgi:long-chain acyl-CoA synthetase